MQASHATLAIAAAFAAFGALGLAVRAETATDIPKNAYYQQVLTPEERSGIAEEENVTPNDGKPSVPPPGTDGIIPDAAIDQTGQDPLKFTKPKKGESEAAVILDDSRKNNKVTSKAMADCMKNWDPQTQMSRAEWKQSCRTTLEYYPEGH